MNESVLLLIYISPFKQLWCKSVMCFLVMMGLNWKWKHLINCCYFDYYLIQRKYILQLFKMHLIYKCGLREHWHLDDIHII